MDSTGNSKQSCSEDPDVKGTETGFCEGLRSNSKGCSEDPDVKGTETAIAATTSPMGPVAARIPM